MGTSHISECVVLLHGLARTKHSMAMLARRLSTLGYRVFNVGYPSRTASIEDLSGRIIPEALRSCGEQNAQSIHFVTHSLGGIIVRHYLKFHEIPNLGCVVMLSPPNRGSEIVDTFRHNWFFRWFNGPAWQQLSTATDSLPNRLGKANFRLGVIAGDRSIDPILSLFIPGKNDGKVSVARTAVEGMKDFKIIHATHPFIMRNRQVIKEVISFLEKERFIER